MTERNQCYGCQAGIPVNERGQHDMGAGAYRDPMVCEAKMYRGKTCIENAKNYTDAAPCAQKTAEFSDDEIIAAANGWREYDAPDGLSPIERMVYGACRAAIAADRKLRGDA